MADLLNLRVSRAWCEARDVLGLELRALAGGVLPPFSAGAHLEIHLPNGLIRHYSLCNDPRERDRYCVGVGLARESRGGSRYLHESLRVGGNLKVSAPRNNFPLADDPGEAVFIAGGIGITPIMAMIRARDAAQQPWRLFYCSRNRQRAAFYEDLCGLSRERCSFHFDDEQQGALFDVPASLRSVAEAAHVYCCGPAPLMEAVKAATAARNASHVHFEWFTAPPVETSADRAFTVVLRQSGARHQVPAGRSILEVLEEHDICVPFSCREGLCATCKTTVVAGIPDHRDSVLSAEERAGNDQILICVSRAQTEVLELDL